MTKRKTDRPAAIKEETLAKRSGLTINQVMKLIEVVKEALLSGERVRLTNLGTLYRHTMPARIFGKDVLFKKGKTGSKKTKGSKREVVKSERDTIKFNVSEKFRYTIDPTLAVRWPDRMNDES